jgi:hypothetical protein
MGAQPNNAASLQALAAAQAAAAGGLGGQQGGMQPGGPQGAPGQGYDSMSLAHMDIAKLNAAFLLRQQPALLGNHLRAL